MDGYNTGYGTGAAGMSDTPDTAAAEVVFERPGGMSFADAMARLGTVDGLSASRRRDLISALRRLAGLFGRPPQYVPANICWLRRRLENFSPALHGLKPKRWANLRSDVMAALQHAGAASDAKTWLPAMAPAWDRLRSQVPDQKARWRLSRLFRFASGLGIGPEAMSDEVVQRFQATLEQESLEKDPERRIRLAINTWNDMREKIPGWPDVALTGLKKWIAWTTPLSAFPESFQADLARHEHYVRNADPLTAGPGDLVRPLAEASVRTRHHQLRAVASAMLETGTPMEAITSLESLTDLERLRPALRWLRGRRNAEGILHILRCVVSIARHHAKVDEAHLAELQAMARRVKQTIDTGSLREKNRRRLAQFNDDAKLRQLLYLPYELLDLIRRGKVQKRKLAGYLQAAVALEILIYSPMRIGNLAGVHIERHMSWPKVQGRACLVFDILPGEVKNRRRLTYELGPESTKIVQHYLQTDLPALLGTMPVWLFQRSDGRHKAPCDLSKILKRVVMERTGLEFTAHVSRSLAAKIHSRRHPGDLATIAHVLHDRLTTVMTSYAQFEGEAARRFYRDSVLNLRDATPAGKKRGRKGTDR